ncbi:MAG: iron-sulfur cluster insertion protein ErpA [Alphaproteobacteria bacterium]|jgi:iron-sulfur cluster insertion protein
MPDGALQDGVNITERGAARLKLLLADEKNPNAKFRVSVLGGGCSGFQYSFSFDDVLNSDDKVFERNGVPIVVDEISLDLLGGAVVDWKEDLSGAMFVIENPNAASSCGCGSSFSI